jgi:hypothetical protein
LIIKSTFNPSSSRANAHLPAASHTAWRSTVN